MLTIRQHPQRPIIIEGFPGFGLVGSIATEFLVEHLAMKPIGEIFLSELDPMVAIHKGKLIQPVGVFYNEQFNIVVVHVIVPAQHIEWKLADAIIELANTLDAYQIVALEGVGAKEKTAPVMYYANNQDWQDKCNEAKLQKLEEGIVMGVTSALMIKAEAAKRSLTALYAMTHSQLPDSKAAAELIKVLDAMLGLHIDYHPLYDAAEMFEKKIKTLMQQSSEVRSERDKKVMSYVG